MWNKKSLSQSKLDEFIVGKDRYYDLFLTKYDCKASIAHVKMLKFQKIISTKICNNIIKGLKVIQDEVINGKFIYDRKFEDIHMNV